MAIGGFFSGLTGGGRGKAGGGGFGFGGGKKSPMADQAARKRNMMADVLERPDFGPPARSAMAGGSGRGLPGGHDPSARKMAARPDLNSPRNLVNSGQSIFQAGAAPAMQLSVAPGSGAAAPTMAARPQGQPMGGRSPMDAEMAMALRRQMEQRRESMAPTGGAKQMRRPNTMASGLVGPTVPTGAVPAMFSSFMNGK